jgi:HSP20 family protein
MTAGPSRRGLRSGIIGTPPEPEKVRMPERSKRPPVFFMPAARACQEVSWHPKADIYRTSDGWILKFDLAGVRPDDVSVVVSGSSITVTGARRDWMQQEGCNHYSMEISYSRFARRIDMPVRLEGARFECEYREGMFLVRVRTEGNQP